MFQNIPSYQSASNGDELFARAFAENSRKESYSKKLLDDFQRGTRVPKQSDIARLLSNTLLRELFVKYNTAM